MHTNGNTHIQKHIHRHIHRYTSAYTQSQKHTDTQKQKYTEMQHTHRNRDTHIPTQTHLQKYTDRHTCRNTYIGTELDTQKLSDMTEKHTKVTITQSYLPSPVDRLPQGQTPSQSHKVVHRIGQQTHDQEGVPFWCPNLQQLSVPKALSQAVLSLGWIGEGAGMWTLSREAKDIGKENQEREDCLGRSQARLVFD